MVANLFYPLPRPPFALSFPESESFPMNFLEAMHINLIVILAFLLTSGVRQFENFRDDRQKLFSHNIEGSIFFQIYYTSFKGLVTVFATGT